MGAARKLELVQGHGEIEGGAPALLPPGDYRLKFQSWSTHLMFGRTPKLALWFTVADFGEFFETRIARWYTPSRLRGKPGPKGAFAAGWSSDLVREYGAICGIPNRNDRVALSRYADRLVIGTVETVVKDRSQKLLASPELHYSVVRRIRPGET